MMKRALALVCSAILCAGLFAACGGGQSPVSDAGAQPVPEDVTLNVVTSYGADDGHRGDYEAAIAFFEASAGIKIADASATSNEAWKTSVMDDFEAGAEPDVLFYFTNSDSDDIVSAGKVVSVEEIRAAYPDYASNMKDDMFVSSGVDGKAYAVPSTGFWEGMFVNTKVLAAAGVAVPGPDYTWKQFLADCSAIKAAGFVPIAASLNDVPHYWFEFAVYNHGSPANHLELPAMSGGGWNAAGKSWIAGLEDIKALYEAGYFPENTLTAQDSETVKLFGDGGAAFLIDGSWKVGYFVSEYPDRLGDYALSFVPGMGERKASDIIGGISMGYFITRKAWDNPAKRAAAVAFVRHMTSDAVLSTFVTTEATALKNGAFPTGLNAMQESAEKMYGKATSVTGAVQDLLSRDVRNSLFASIKEIVTGQISAEEAMSAIEN